MFAPKELQRASFSDRNNFVFVYLVALALGSQLIPICKAICLSLDCMYAYSEPSRTRVVYCISSLYSTKLL